MGACSTTDHAVQPAAQEAHARVDLAQPLLAVGVLGVLGAIALGCGGADRRGDLRTLDAPELVQFGAQPREALQA